MLVTLLLFIITMRIAALYSKAQSLVPRNGEDSENALPDRIWNVKLPYMTKEAAIMFLRLWLHILKTVVTLSVVATLAVYFICVMVAVKLLGANFLLGLIVAEALADAVIAVALYQWADWVEDNWWVVVEPNTHAELLVNGVRDAKLIIGEGAFPWPWWNKVYTGIQIDTSTLPKQFDAYNIFGVDSSQAEKDKGTGELYITISFNATRSPANLHAATSNPNAEASLENAAQTSARNVCNRHPREKLRDGKFQNEVLAGEIYRELEQAAIPIGWHISPPRRHGKPKAGQHDESRVGIEALNWASEQLRQAMEKRRIASYQRDAMDVTEAGLRKNAIDRVTAMGYKSGTEAYQRALLTELRAMEEVFLGIRFAETGAGNVRISGTGGLPTLTVLPQRVSVPKQPTGGATAQPPRGKKSV